MESETVKDVRNEFLKRREVEVVIDNHGNPGLKESKKVIVEKFKGSEPVIVIKHLGSEFGKKEFVIDAFIYDSVEDLKNIEPRNKKEEARLAEEAKKQAIENKAKKELEAAEKAKVVESSAEEAPKVTENTTGAVA